MKEDYGKYIVLIVVIVALFGLFYSVQSSDLVGQGYITVARGIYTPGAGNIVDGADPGGRPGYASTDPNQVLPGELAYKRNIRVVLGDRATEDELIAVGVPGFIIDDQKKTESVSPPFPY